MTNYRDKFLNNEADKLKTTTANNNPYGADDYNGVPLYGKSNIESKVESDRFMQAYTQQMLRYVPEIDYTDPETFCFYGSAEKYYRDTIDRIRDTYPYDGSRAEKIEWSLSSSYLDLYFLEHEYPKSTGFLKFDRGAQTGDNGFHPTTANPVYVSFFGGPHVGTVYDASKNRENNIKIDGTKGNTVEFWLKKHPDSWLAYPRREVIMDVCSTTGDFNKIGRFSIELQRPNSATVSPFLIRFTSGSTGTATSGVNRGQRVGSSNITTASVGDSQWHHYAVSISSDDSNTTFKLYVDGVLDHTSVDSFSIGPIDTPLSGAIGGASPGSGLSDATTNAGSGMLSGSLDEFRYWKTARTEKEIAKNWYRPVYGGTDSDHTNANLGLYYKFNEGTTGTQQFDEVVLDYSGRINNGKITNWTSTVRSTGSAINSSTKIPSSEETFVEKGDPILYESNSKFTEIESYFKSLGQQHDRSNMSSMKRTVPSFTLDQDQSRFPELLQIISSTMDDLFIKIKLFPKIKDYTFEDLLDKKGKVRSVKMNSFLFGCDVDREHQIVGSKTKPWVSKILEHYGLTVTSPLQSLSVEEFYNNMTDKITFEQKIYEVKNTVLSNIHKNLINIYKTKGTEASFRNMIRCFGIDNEILKLNVYTNNESKTISNSKSFETVKQKSLDFASPENSKATLYQSATLSHEKDFIPGASVPLSYTMECNIILPKRTDLKNVITKSSIFGLKTSGGEEL